MTRRRWSPTGPRSSAAGHYDRRHRGAGATAVAADDGPPAPCWTSAAAPGHHLAGVLDRRAGGRRHRAGRLAATRPAGPPGPIRGPMAVVADTWARLPVPDGAVDRVLGRVRPAQRRRDRPGAATRRAARRRHAGADHLHELVGPLGLLRVDPDKPRGWPPRSDRTWTGRASTGTASGCCWTAPRCATLVGMGPHARHLDAATVRARVAAPARAGRGHPRRRPLRPRAGARAHRLTPDTREGPGRGGRAPPWGALCAASRQRVTERRCPSPSRRCRAR